MGWLIAFGPVARAASGAPGDGVEAGEDGAAALDEARLHVEDAFAFTNGLHVLFEAGELVAGRVREEVMFDLVVEADHEHVADHAAANVAGGYNLLLQERHVAIDRQGSHALVVGREAVREVKARSQVHSYEHKERFLDGEQEKRTRK